MFKWVAECEKFGEIDSGLAETREEAERLACAWILDDPFTPSPGREDAGKPREETEFASYESVLKLVAEGKFAEAIERFNEVNGRWDWEGRYVDVSEYEQRAQKAPDADKLTAQAAEMLEGREWLERHFIRIATNG